MSKSLDVQAKDMSIFWRMPLCKPGFERKKTTFHLQDLSFFVNLLGKSSGCFFLHHF